MRRGDSLSLRIISTVIGLTCLFAPLAQLAGSETQKAKAEAAIRKALAHWVEAANHGDWKETLMVWAPDLIGWYPGAPDNTYTREVANAARVPPVQTTYEVEVQEVLHSGSLAVVRDIWKFTTKRPDGKSVVDTVRSFEVWREQSDGTWKISRWISAPEPPKK